MIPKFTVADLLVAIAGVAITLTMWQRIPDYETWRWNHDLLTYETSEPPRGFTKHRTAIDHPTPFGKIRFDNGVDLFHDQHRRGFEDAVDEFLHVANWPPPINDVVMEHPEDWPDAHYSFAYECGYSHGVKAINNLLVTRNKSELRLQLDRDRSYVRKYYGLAASVALLTLLVMVRVLRGQSARSRASHEVSHDKTHG